MRHLWLSISSVNFYIDVYRVYKGYGFKYILSLAFLSSLICTIYFINSFVYIKNNLQQMNPESQHSDLEQVLSQWPEINYNGRTISVGNITPFYIYHPKSKQKLIAIDPENILSYQEKQNIPIILSNKKIIVNFILHNGSHQISSVSYTEIFGNDAKNISQEDIRAIIIKILDQGYLLFILVPVFVCIITLKVIFDKSILILLIYIIAKIVRLEIIIETIIRMVLFASGLFVLLKPIITITLPSAELLLWMVQSCANILLITALFKIYKTQGR